MKKSVAIAGLCLFAAMGFAQNVPKAPVPKGVVWARLCERAAKEGPLQAWFDAGLIRIEAAKTSFGGRVYLTYVNMSYRSTQVYETDIDGKTLYSEVIYDSIPPGVHPLAPDRETWKISSDTLSVLEDDLIKKERELKTE